MISVFEKIPKIECHCEGTPVAIQASNILNSTGLPREYPRNDEITNAFVIFFYVWYTNIIFEHSF